MPILFALQTFLSECDSPYGVVIENAGTRERVLAAFPANNPISVVRPAYTELNSRIAHSTTSSTNILGYTILYNDRIYARLLFVRPTTPVAQTSIIAIIDAVKDEIINKAQMITVSQLIIRDIHTKMQCNITKMLYALTLLPSLVRDAQQFELLLQSMGKCCCNTMCCLNNIRDLIHCPETTATADSFAERISMLIESYNSSARIDYITAMSISADVHFNINYSYYGHICNSILDILTVKYRDYGINVSRLGVDTTTVRHTGSPYYIRTAFHCMTFESPVTTKDFYQINLADNVNFQTCNVVVEHLRGHIEIIDKGIVVYLPIFETQQKPHRAIISDVPPLPPPIDIQLGHNAQSIVVIAESPIDRATIMNALAEYICKPAAFTDISEFNAILNDTRAAISAVIPMAISDVAREAYIALSELATDPSVIVIVEDYNDQMTTTKYNPAFRETLRIVWPQATVVVIEKNNYTYFRGDNHIVPLTAPVEYQRFASAVKSAMEHHSTHICNSPKITRSPTGHRTLVIHHCYITRMYLLAMMQDREYGSTCAWGASMHNLPTTLSNGNITQVDFTHSRTMLDILLRYNVFLIEKSCEDQYSILKQLAAISNKYIIMIGNLSPEEKCAYPSVNRFLTEPVDVSQINKCFKPPRRMVTSLKRRLSIESGSSVE